MHMNSRKRSLCLGSNPWTCIKTSKSLMMDPNLNSIVFYYKTTMWSLLSWTTCSHVCRWTISCFGACYHSSFPDNLATSSRRFVLQNFFSDMLSLYYHITNWIWMLGRYDGWNIPNSCILFPACTAIVPNFPWAALLSSCCPRSSSKVDLPWVPSISDDKQNHPLRCLQQGSPHHPF